MSNLTATFNTGVTTLAGPNGAGKSSLFRVVAGLQRPNAGSVVMGTASSDPAHQWQRMVGYLPQEPDFSGGVSVTDTVALAGWLKSMPDAELNNAVRDALNLVGLTDRARDRVRALSGGMRRRLGFATAAVHRPALLVLDEPTAWNWRISACRPRSGDELPAVAPHVGWTLSRSGRHRPRRRTPVARLVVSGQLGGHHLEATSMAVLLLPFVMLAGAQDGHRLLRTLRIRPRHRVPGHPARLWCTSSRPSRCGVWADTCWSW